MEIEDAIETVVLVVLRVAGYYATADTIDTIEDTIEDLSPLLIMAAPIILGILYAVLFTSVRRKMQ